VFSRDGATVVAGASCGEVYVWRARTGKLVRRMVLPNQISALALAHDDRTIAAAAPDGPLTLIDAATGAQRSIAGAPRGINSLAFGAGDKTLASGIDDSTIRIWDPASGRLLREMQFGAPVAARFTPRGRDIVAAELTGALRVIDACPSCDDGKALRAQAADRLTRKLTADEKRTYLSGF
jgi:WD40 repeat protein